MWTIGIIGFAIFAALFVTGYMFYRAKKQRDADDRILELQIQNDTARIIQQHRIEEVDKSWEEYDKQQWEKRFEGETK
jgi:hypothetical protein